MSNFISDYIKPNGEKFSVTFIDNKGQEVPHPGGISEYNKDYYFVIFGEERLSMTEFREYVKNNNLKEN